MEKVKGITKIIFKALWILISLGLWIYGITMFIENINAGTPLIGWFIWGLICTPAILGIVLGTAITTTGSVKDKITGFIGGLLGGIAIGPITLALKTIINFRNLIDMIRYSEG